MYTLVELRIEGNVLSGAIPTELGGLVNLGKSKVPKL
jgi:hypothetical protein